MPRRLKQFTHDLGDFTSVDDEIRSVFNTAKTSWYERTKNTRGLEAKDDMNTVQNFLNVINTGFHARGNNICYSLPIWSILVTPFSTQKASS
jgi:hypothetical protein